jgi:hypothetical protein
MGASLRRTLGELPRLRGDGWGGVRCGAIDTVVGAFVEAWPCVGDGGIKHYWTFTSGDVQTFIAYEYKTIVSRDSIRRRLHKHPEVRIPWGGRWCRWCGN